MGYAPASAISTVDSLNGASTQGSTEARTWDAGCGRNTDATPSCCTFASVLNPVPYNGAPELKNSWFGRLAVGLRS